MYSKLVLGVLVAQSLVTLNASVCITGTLASYEALTTTGCSEGPLTFKDFSFTTISLTSTPPATLPTPATANEITLTPPAKFGSLLGFTYAPIDNSLGVTAGQEIEYALTYLVDFPPIIVGGQGDADDPDTGNGVSTVTETLTPVPQFTAVPKPPPACSTKLPAPVTITLSLNASTPSAMQNAELSHPTCIVDVSITFDLDALTGGTADLSSFTQFTAVPEPSYACFCGLGAALIAIARRVQRRG
jgi:hypothetical protein